MPKKPPPAPTKPENPHTSATMLRFDPALLRALDEWTAKLNEKGRGPRWTRTDLIRAALTRAVKEWGESGDEP